MDEASDNLPGPLGLGRSIRVGSDGWGCSVHVAGVLPTPDPPIDILFARAMALLPPDHIQSPAQSRSYRIAKRGLDLLAALLGLVLVTPLILVLALAVRLDSPGPAFFRQWRVGYRGRPFSIIKLRTMLDPRDVNPAVGPDAPDSLRITRVGGVLRRWSLDELPQLVNVLRGEMSLVGPRPELPAIVRARYAPWQYQRFLVPQGMTGWWQIMGRGRGPLYEHTQDDLYYLARASFGFDLTILWRTFPAVVRQAGVL